jgi:hypothetical protein
MNDPFIVMDAQRLGYEILTIDGKIYFRKQLPLNGPYKTLDEAAKAAITDHCKTVKSALLQNGTHQ